MRHRRHLDRGPGRARLTHWACIHDPVIRVFRHKAFRQVVSWLALLAMALVVVMPAVSRVMPMTASMPSMQGMAEACPQRTGEEKHPAPGHPADPTDRCGYCVLFGHQSILASSHVLHLLPAAPGAAESTPLPVRRKDATRRLSADPRGPPRIA
ncbi:DUF2946 domain-containing protein [Rhodanobacter terrae]|uniref:DUF2946 domain-containing protein n=1 Tax=Rhodanobacter terrae TaxID=418647 RepID=A0ABW0T2R6_9GAMM